MIVELLAVGTAVLSAVSDGLNRRWKVARALRDPDMLIRALHQQGGEERARTFIGSMADVQLSGEDPSSKLISWTVLAPDLDALKARAIWADSLIAAYNRRYSRYLRFQESFFPHDPADDGPESPGDIPSFGPAIMPIHSNDPDDWGRYPEDWVASPAETQKVLVSDLVRLVAEDPGAVAARLGHHEPQLWSWDATRLLIRVHDGTAARPGHWLIVPRPARPSSSP